LRVTNAARLLARVRMRTRPARAAKTLISVDSFGPSVPPAWFGGGKWPAAGYSGLFNPNAGCFVRDEKPPLARKKPRPLGRWFDRTLAALSAVYVPLRRIGFLMVSLI